MVSHLVLVLTILLSRDEYVKACLPFDYEEDAFARKDVELATGLGVAIGLLAIEFLGFLSGIAPNKYQLILVVFIPLGNIYASTIYYT
jgi:hypothetical protein